MGKYIVSFTHEIVQSKYVEIEADSEKEALGKFENGDYAGEEIITSEDGFAVSDVKAEKVEEE